MLLQLGKKVRKINWLEEYALEYARLLRLLETDSMQVAEGIQGDLLDAYRSVLKLEKSTLSRTFGKMQNSLDNY